MNQANFLPGYEVITMIIVLVTTKEKSLGIDLNQDNWMLVILLLPCKHLHWSAITYVLSNTAECIVFNRNTCNATREKLGQCSHNVYLWLPGLASHMHCWVPIVECMSSFFEQRQLLHRHNALYDLRYARILSKIDWQLWQRWCI